METQILNPKQITQKISRMAIEIYERNYGRSEVVLVGIDGEGYHLARLLDAEIQKTTPLKTTLVKLKVDKTAQSQPPIHTDIALESLAGKSIIVVDDVLNTGRTLLYAIHPFSSISIPELQVAVLVARNHLKFPVRADFVGYGISTTLSENIIVRLSGTDEPIGAYLN